MSEINIIFIFGISLISLSTTISIILWIRFHQQKLYIAHINNKHEQRFNLLTNIINALTTDLPLHNHPGEQYRKVMHQLQNTLNLFSGKIQNTVQNQINEENNLWNDKFSLVLKLIDKTPEHLNTVRDEVFKESWDSVTKLRKQSQLLFYDMKEDGIFFRMNSLWALSNLNISQYNYDEAWRHIVAALKLYCDSHPTLPVTNNLVWQIGQSLYDCSLECSKKHQLEALERFNISAEEIVNNLSQLDNLENNIEILQLLKIWSIQVHN